MQTTTTLHIEKSTEVKGYILDVAGLGRTMYLEVDGGGNRVCFIVGKNTDLLDKLANEAERLTREFIGDVPPLEPLAPSQAYLDEIGEMQTAELHGGPEVA